MDTGTVGVSPSSWNPQGREKKAQVSIQEDLNPQPPPLFGPCKWGAEGTLQGKARSCHPQVLALTPLLKARAVGASPHPKTPEDGAGCWPRAGRKDARPMASLHLLCPHPALLVDGDRAFPQRPDAALFSCAQCPGSHAQLNRGTDDSKTTSLLVWATSYFGRRPSAVI